MKRFTAGIDVGSISASMVLIDEKREIVKSEYLFHNGDVEGTLNRFIESASAFQVDRLAVTSSTPAILKNAAVYDSRVAIVTASREIHDKPGAVLFVGGEKFGLYLFDDDGEYLNYRSNSSCAAGTGSFLDQQSGRLNLSGIDEFTKMALANRGPIPQIASRCAVFAKTDLIHAQQEGYSTEEICDGLSYGLAKNIADTLMGNTDIKGNLIFAGGVAKNSAVRKHLEDILETEIETDEFSHLYGALGAAILSQNEQEGADLSEDLFEMGTVRGDLSFAYDPLELVHSTYPDFSSIHKYDFKSEIYITATDVEVDVYCEPEKGREYSVYFGIDIGSTSTKAVLVDEKKEVFAGFYTRTSGRPVEATQTILESMGDMENRYSIKFRFAGAGTTGSGRKFIGGIVKADLALDEISAHARAAYELDNEVDTIIEIGGQDAKFTTMKNGMVTFSYMNNVCAAGTGSFIEEQARKLNCPLSEYADRASSVSAPMASDRCTVFMERDINNLLTEGYTVDQVLASVLHSVRENYLSKVAVEASIGSKIFFQGATAKNRALVAAFEQRLGREIMVSPFCHLTGALGVALQMIDDGVKETEFRGIDFAGEKVNMSTEVCELCGNNCKIKIANVNGQISAFGFLCGRDYDTKSFVNQNKSGFDLLKERRKIFAFKKDEPKFDGTIGLPAALFLHEELPLWEKFFNILGLRTVTSESCKTAVSDGKEVTGAEFCAPMSALHGHVQYLKERADYIFLPIYLQNKQKDKYKNRHFCYYSQFATAIVSVCKDLDIEDRLLSPMIRSVIGDFYMKVELHRMMNRICKGKVNFFQVSGAYDKALSFYNEGKTRLKDSYLSQSGKKDDIDVVILGRPYTVLSDSMNSGIPGIFGKLGVRAFYQDMVPVEEGDSSFVQELLDTFHWEYASKILEVTNRVADSEGVYPVLVTSFKCSPDSFVMEYFKEIMDAKGKPYLILQLDELDSSVGYETRIEAGVRAFRNDFRAVQDREKRTELPDAGLIDKVKLKEKILFLPNWDNITGKLLEANFRHEGYDARLLEETEGSIRRSMTMNTGQCIPLNAVAQSAIEYIENKKINPEDVALWFFDSCISCNVAMYPRFIKTLLERHGNGLDKVSLYNGEIAFNDISYSAAINGYFAYMFAGMLRKISCKIRPYELVKGETDGVTDEAVKLLYKMFLNGTVRRDGERTLRTILDMYGEIKTEKTERPLVAIFGDLYARDNEIMNQNLIKVIEDNGGEVLTTPYSDYLKLIADPYLHRWFTEGKYMDVASGKILRGMILFLEKKYMDMFHEFLHEPKFQKGESFGKVLEKYNLRSNHTGESMDNILKIHHLVEAYPDISLFVQTNPAFCCPSLVTEAMASKIEEVTGVPIVTIEYDGTGASKNDDIIPYLKFPRKRKGKADDEKAV